jgi:hypothetical protein
MAKEIKSLAKAFAVKDAVESFLSNLNKLKADGSIAEGQYATLKAEYEQRLNAATSEITQIKTVFKKQLETAKRDVGIYKIELGRLEVKYKVGELPLNKYQGSDRKLRATIEGLEANVTELNRLIAAKNSADIIAPTKRPGAAAPKLPTTAKKAAPVKEIKLPKTKLPKTRMAALPSLARAVPSEEGLLRPRTKIAALVGGALLLISVFLPWIAASEKLGKGLGSESGMGVSMIIGAAGIIGGLVAIGSAFFPSPKARSAVQIVMAVLALAVLPAIVLTGILPLLSEYFRSLVVIRQGPYVYIIAAILLIITGSLERRQR